MSELTLVLGNKNYSTWSLRAWLAARMSGLPFSTETIWLDVDVDRSQRLQISPTGKVPVLKTPDITLWDSLAIGEYLAERAPNADLWPRDLHARAYARTLCAEMHSSFFEVRTQLPMNCRAQTTWFDRGPELDAELQRIETIFADTRERFGTGGKFLFGKPSLADAFYTPVASRLHTYGYVARNAVAAGYVQTLIEWVPFRDWFTAAQLESHRMPNIDAQLKPQ